MKPITDNVALVLCFSLCFSFFHLLNADSQQLVGEACANAKYKDLCMSSLNSEYATRDAHDLDTIALIAIKAASNNGSNTANYIRRRLDTLKMEPAVEQTFDDCSENYISAIQQLNDALSALVSKKYKDSKVWLEAAVTDATSCETSLREAPGNEMELGSRNSIFLQLCNSALDIMSYLVTKFPAGSPEGAPVKAPAPSPAKS